MIGGDDQLRFHFRNALDDRQQRGVLEPGTGERPVGRLIRSQLADDLHFSSRVGKHIHKIIHDHVQVVMGQVVDIVEQNPSLVEVLDFLIGEPDIHSQPFDVTIKKIFLMIVFPAFLVLIHPYVRIFL